jgi:Suppressor of fused protein (SUFU)
MPEPGTLTMVTYGISEAMHPDWKQGRPELVVSLDSEDMAWGMAAAYMAEAARGDFPFAYSQVLNFNRAISEESPMSAFFLFAPSFLNGEQAKLTLPNKMVFLYGAYPLYPGETELIERIGLEKFWNLPGFDLYDVKRPDLSKEA